MAGTAQPMGQTQIPTSPLATQTKGNYRPPINTLGQRVGGIQPATLPEGSREDLFNKESIRLGRNTRFGQQLGGMSTMNGGVNPMPMPNMPTMPWLGGGQPNQRMIPWEGGLGGAQQIPATTYDFLSQKDDAGSYMNVPKNFTHPMPAMMMSPHQSLGYRNSAWNNQLRNMAAWGKDPDNLSGEGDWGTENPYARFGIDRDSFGGSTEWTPYVHPPSQNPDSGGLRKILPPGGGTLNTPADFADPITGATLPRTPQPIAGVDLDSIRPLLPPGGTPNMPEGFTQGAGGRRIVPWTNSVTGETWNAPSEGYKPPSSDWQQDSGQKIKFGGINSETGAGIPMQPGQNTPRIGGGSTNPEALGGGGTAGQTQQPTAGAQQPANINTLAAEGIKAAGYSTGQGLDFTPSDVSADNIYSSTVAPGTVTSGSYTPGMVTANQLATTGLDPYMNPYTQQVIDANQADILRGADIGLDQLGAQANRAKAFGGSRHGIAMSEMGRGVAEQLARSSAGLRQANFAQAQQAAQQDIGTNLQGQLANQGAGLQAGLANVGTGLQANLANQQTGLQSSLANQANLYNTGQANQSANLQAALANQGAGMQGQGMRLGAANQLANISNLGFGMGQQVSQNLAAQGAMQQALQQAVMEAAKQKYGQYTGYPAQGLQYLNQALGITPGGSGTTTKSKQPGLFDYLTLATTAYTGNPG